MGHLCLEGLKDTILTELTTEDADELLADAGKNAEAYTELIQFLEKKKKFVTGDARLRHPMTGEKL